MSDGLKPVLIDLCRSLPGATEDVKWGDHLVFSVATRMFAVFETSASEALTIKVDPAVAPILTREPGIAPAPYLARHAWVRLEHLRVLPRATIAGLVRESYDLVVEKLPKRVRVQLVGDGS